MTEGVPPRLATYAREIERLWNAMADGPGVLSPRDWERIRSWHDRGIPLQIVREAMESIAERRTRSRASWNLSRVAPVVDEAWQVVLDGRLADVEPVGEPSPASRSAIESLRAALAHAPSPSTLRDLLEGALRDAERGEPAERIDRRIDEGLPDAVPAETLIAARQGADAAVVPIRRRMDASLLAATRNRIVVARLRRHLQLPKLENDEAS